ncbi:MAG: hypothetical protein KBT07_05970 [Clostridiales bacterium]|nr:hypothetical protein [Candidatus Scatonaster coprocaballi]
MMDRFQREVMNRRICLERVIRSAEDKLGKAPPGSLRVDGSKKVPVFYVHGDDMKKRVYIPRDNMELVERLAQKAYMQSVWEKANKELRILKKYEWFLQNQRADLVYADLRKVRQELVTPLIVDNETYARAWEREKYPTNPFRTEELKYETKRGEKVRSKSETFQANIYYELGIPYRYECELRLRNEHMCYPDFTLLDVQNRQVIYHEHLGLMDNNEYRERALRKIREYERNGIYVGKNLILTSETAEFPFNPEMFRRRMKETFRV